MTTKKLSDLKIKIFADGADFQKMVDFSAQKHIKGFTTNPSLMHQAGITDYEAYARQLIKAIPNHPISFEVFADDLPSMERQARYIASWGKNVNVKIPVTNTKGEFTGPIIKRLSNDGIILNVTAITTPEQVQQVCDHFANTTNGIISVLAGRIADTGIDPIPLMQQSLDILAKKPNLELLWAASREILNIIQADHLKCHIITVAHSILDKLSSLGKDLTEYSLEAVKIFARDAKASNFSIKDSN